ncbi:unnamed protein product [Zymoseptoria tritici ST99CH_3D7]|uniref:Uncharacterized protein n=1 Tax=Zymoseptoria tritici (strain ST99CH_3D7) TaxID=1276538 RepID=A0A1X7RDI2_ZYMT9|nr:unnamed protein product [Zymoseptoria tritici ST99CH_3D7]
MSRPLGIVQRNTDIVLRPPGNTGAHKEFLAQAAQAVHPYVTFDQAAYFNANDLEKGLAGSDGPSGVPGPSGAPGNTFGYLGCYVQTSTSRALFNYQGAYSAFWGSQCTTACQAGNFLYMGIVNLRGADDVRTGGCWCDNRITYVNSGRTGASGDAGENNCILCAGGATPGGTVGACGSQDFETIAIYARGF